MNMCRMIMVFVIMVVKMIMVMVIMVMVVMVITEESSFPGLLEGISGFWQHVDEDRSQEDPRAHAQQAANYALPPALPAGVVIPPQDDGPHLQGQDAEEEGDDEQERHRDYFGRQQIHGNFFGGEGRLKKADPYKYLFVKEN